MELFSHFPNCFLSGPLTTSTKGSFTLNVLMPCNAISMKALGLTACGYYCHKTQLLWFYLQCVCEEHIITSLELGIFKWTVSIQSIFEIWYYHERDFFLAFKIAFKRGFGGHHLEGSFTLTVVNALQCNFNEGTWNRYMWKLLSRNTVTMTLPIMFE
jgi:hypothetical protein